MKEAKFITLKRKFASNMTKRCGDIFYFLWQPKTIPLNADKYVTADKRQRLNMILKHTVQIELNEHIVDSTCSRNFKYLRCS